MILDKEVLEKFASIAAEQYLKASIPLNDSIEVIARNNELNPHQISRCCEQANNLTVVAIRKLAKDSKGTLDPRVSFPLANSREVLKKLNSVGKNSSTIIVLKPTPADYASSNPLMSNGVLLDRYFGEPVAEVPPLPSPSLLAKSLLRGCVPEASPDLLGRAGSNVEVLRDMAVSDSGIRKEKLQRFVAKLKELVSKELFDGKTPTDLKVAIRTTGVSQKSASLVEETIDEAAKEMEFKKSADVLTFDPNEAIIQDQHPIVVTAKEIEDLVCDIAKYSSLAKRLEKAWSLSKRAHINAVRKAL